ncbi:MAG: NAD(P)/FAD-dependent oxidoreductase [Rhodospirillales bacterium]|nr:NAD(P)/FAD-dependent oxidoreductase [Rhodospirillales bacterium]
MQYVILGAGPSGVVAAETLRKTDPDGDVLLIGGEPEPPYSRMAIPYYLTGGIEESGTYLRKTDGHYDALGITYQQGRAEKVTPKKGTITLEGGDTVSYDKLLVATGSTPLKPPIKGLDQPGVHHCWTLEDARNILKLADKGSDVVLMGAGFIGCIILESLFERGVNLTVVEAQDRMVPRMMNQTAGGLIKKWCEDKGITVLTSTKVTELEPTGEQPDSLKVDLDNGKSINAHLVVVATGVQSNTGFLKGSGVKIEDGIIVDNRMQSSVDGIYAAGDVAQGPDIAGGWMVHAVQPTAVDHARIAALNMAGREARYKGSLNMNVLDTAGLVSSSFGQWQGVDGGTTVEAVDADTYRYMSLSFDGDRLVGALSLGHTDHIGVIRGIIQSGLALGDWKDRLAEDPTRVMEAYLACTQG